MLCILLLEKAQEIVINVGTTGFYISIAGVIGTLGIGIWRMSAAFSDKADKSYVDDVFKKKMDQDDFDAYVENHEELHNTINKSLLRELEQSSNRTQQFIQDVLTRMEENSQYQREFNKDIVKKQDELFKQQGEMMIKIGKIETSLGVLVNDFNNRQVTINRKRE